MRSGSPRPLWLLAVLACAALACSGSGSEVYLVVTVDGEAPASVDRLRVTLWTDGGAGEAATREYRTRGRPLPTTLSASVPASLAGSDLALEVQALAGNEVVACARTVARPERGRPVAVSISLHPEDCEDAGRDGGPEGRDAGPDGDVAPDDDAGADGDADTDGGADLPDAPLDAADGMPDLPGGDADAGDGAAPDAPDMGPLVPQGASCADIRETLGRTTDGVYVIDPDAFGPLRPFAVYCRGMATASPTEYLELVRTSGEGQQTANYATFASGGDCTCPTTVRRFTRVRLELDPLAIVTTDITFSLLEADLSCAQANPACAQSLDNWFGRAASCIAEGDASGRANIDLRGTPFHLAVAESLQFRSDDGPGATGSAGSVLSASPDAKVYTLAGGGRCGGFGPPPPARRFALAQD